MDVPKEYLCQFYLTDIPNPSDDSDFIDTSYECDEQIKKEIQERKENEKLEFEKEQYHRRIYFENYKNKNSQKQNSLFNMKGIFIKMFTHQTIKFTFTPYEIDNKYHHPSEIYYISFKYSKTCKRWLLRQNNCPGKDVVIRTFQKNVYDDTVLDKIIEIYNIMLRETEKLKQDREEKELIISLGADIENDISLTPIEEEILLEPEVLQELKAKRDARWERMRVPEHLEPTKKRRKLRIIYDSD